MRIYLTHCTGIKDESLQNTKKKVLPDVLYRSAMLQRFAGRCREQGVKWAIFSDKHGIWFPEVEHSWYDKHPDSVSAEELKWLVENFDDNLNNFTEIWFYNNPAWFHRLYKTVLKQSALSKRIKLFSHLKEVI